MMNGMRDQRVVPTSPRSVILAIRHFLITTRH